MSKHTINRVEEKYIVSKVKYNKLVKELLKHTVHDEYYRMKVCNLYYDTKDYDLIRRSLDKPVYREKIRIRSYDIPKLDSIVYVEIKKKYNNMSNKRRVDISLKEAYQLLEKHDNANDKQIICELLYAKESYLLQPSCYISYDREAYVDKLTKSIRITFDNNLICRDYDLLLEKGCYGVSILDSDDYIMEIKTDAVIPMWLSRIMTELRLYPCSFSKYGTFYRIINEKRGI